MDVALSSLPFEKLADISRQEISNFSQHKSYNPDYLYELFRRAIVERSERAWELIYHLFSPIVQKWVELDPSFAASREEAEFFVNDAFAKMWGVVTPEKFKNFSNLNSLLQYLKLCTRSVIINHLRAAQKNEPLALDAAVEDVSTAEEYVADMTRQEFWPRITERLKNEKERQLLYYRFVLGLKPQRIVEQHAETFPDLKEVFVLTQTILARLRRDPSLKDFTREPFAYESIGAPSSPSIPTSTENLPYRAPSLPKAVSKDINALDDHAQIYAIAGLKDHPVEQLFQVNKLYTLQAGIHHEAPLGFEKMAVSLSMQAETTRFDIAVNAEDMSVQPNWIQPYLYSRGDEPSLVDFLLEPLTPGHKQIRVEFYHERHWLAKIEFEISVIGAQELVEAL